MNSTIYLNNFIEKIDNIRNEEFEKCNIIITETEILKKSTNENLMDFRNYASNMKKKALKDKSKASNVGKTSLDIESGSNVNILEDDLFNNNENENQEEFKLNIEELTLDEKYKIIEEFIKRKGIDLDETNKHKIEELLKSEGFCLKKFLTISKVYQQITKISFLKKVEGGTYVVDISDKKIKNKNLFFK
jgi:HD superfamily phosphohydrolase